MKHARPHTDRRGFTGESGSFFGREDLLEQIAQAQRDTRAIVVTGISGIGKSRLAIHASHVMRSRYADGIAYLDLNGMTDGRLLPVALLSELRITASPDSSAEEQLLEILALEQRLIVLDNCERLRKHVIRIVNAIVGASPASRIIVTSREPLDIDGSLQLAVHPLSEQPAVELFVDRARSVCPSLELSGENVIVLHRICRRLDYVPLAIELAAPGLASLEPEALLERLMQPDTRQALLDGLLEWHYKHLPEPYRYIFLCAAVFVGSFSPSALAAIGGGTVCEDVGEAIASLLRRSLLVKLQTESGEPRFRMLPTVREYAVSKLKGEPKRARLLLQRHAVVFSDLAIAQERELRGGEPLPAMRRLELEQDNLRTALTSFTTASHRERRACLPMLAALARYWYLAVSFSEALFWFERLVDRTWPPSRELVHVLSFWSLFSARRDSPRQAMALADEALAAAKTLDDPRALLMAHNARGNVFIEMGAWSDAAAEFSRVQNHARSLGDLWWTGAALVNRSRAFMGAGEYYRAEQDANALAELAAQMPGLATVAQVAAAWTACGLQRYEEALERVEDALELGSRSGELYFEHGALELAALLTARGYAPQAAYHDRHLSLSRQFGDQQALAFGLIRAAAMLAGSDAEGALIALGAVQAAQRRRGVPLPAVYDRLMRAILARLDAEIPTLQVQATFARGGQLSLDDALRRVKQQAQ